MRADTSKIEYLLEANIQAELARRNMLDFVQYVKPNYKPNWHHELLCSYLDRFVRGEIPRLAVFMPPQHGKLLPCETPIFTTKGWKAHGDLKPGDFVFGIDGKPKAVLANSGAYRWNVEKVNFQGGLSIFAAKEHEWLLECDHDDHKGRRPIVYETQQIFKKRHRRNPAINISKALELPEKDLLIDPYILGCWLGDGNSRQGVLTVGKEDIEHFQKLGEAREVKPGIYRVLISGLTTKLRASNLLLNKHIPNEYLTASMRQRMELLRGLMDTDGCVDFRGRCEFAQKENGLADSVYTLLRTLGIKASLNIYKAKIGGKSVGFKNRVTFSPSKGIEIFSLPRKRQKLQLKSVGERDDKGKFFIESITPHGEVFGNCIQVEGSIYLAGPHLIPTHNSELVSRCLPAFSLGFNPENKIVGASYSATLANSFNRDAQRVMDSSLYRDVFPETRISMQETDGHAGPGKWKRTNELVEVIGKGGFFKTTGVGGSLTGTPADIAIIDDPVKDAVEAMSSTYQERNWNWYTDVLSTRLHNDSKVLITQTRWDVNDLSGKILKQMEEGGEQWEILMLPAIKTIDGHKDDPRQVGEPLWPERHSLDKLLSMRKKSLRTFSSLYQQSPKAIQAGGEFWKGFNPEKHVGQYRYLLGEPVHLTLDDNVNPYVTVGVWQFKSSVKQIRQVHELAARDPINNAPKAAMEIAKYLRANHHENIVYIYGDPSASKRSTVDANSASFFDKFIEILRLEGFKVVSRVKKSMPEIQLSANFINEIYEQGLYGFSIVVDAGCTVSIEDYYTVKEDKEGKMQKIKRTNPTTGIQYEPFGHFSDAKRYFIMTLLAAEFEKYKVKDNAYNVITQ